MSDAGWKRAFCRAQETEAEGEKYFEGFFKRSKTISGTVTAAVNDDLKSGQVGSLRNAAAEVTDEITQSVSRPTEPGETEDVERGGFCQPAGLATFFKNLISSRSEIAGHDDAIVDHEDISDLPVAVVRENGMARQICRAWLKNNFLKLGEACKNPNCERRHIIDSCSVGMLYKDYSFKGLTAAQRNSIIAQVQSGAGKTIANVVPNTISAVKNIAEEKNTTKPPAVSLSSIDISVIRDETIQKIISSGDSLPEMTKSVSNDSHVVTKISSEDCSPVEASNHAVNPTSLSFQGQPILDNILMSSVVNEKIDSGNKSFATIGRQLLKKFRKPWMPLHKQITY